MATCSCYGYETVCSCETHMVCNVVCTCESHDCSCDIHSCSNIVCNYTEESDYGCTVECSTDRCICDKVCVEFNDCGTVCACNSQCECDKECVCVRHCLCQTTCTCVTYTPQ